MVLQPWQRCERQPSTCCVWATFSRSAPACRKVNALIRKAENLGARKDQRYGKRKLGSELPYELQRRHGRPVRIRQSRKEMETGQKQPETTHPIFLLSVTVGELRRSVELIRYRGDQKQATRLEQWLDQVLHQNECSFGVSAHW